MGELSQTALIALNEWIDEGNSHRDPEAVSTPEHAYTPTTERVRDGFAHSYLGDGSEADPRRVVVEQLGEFDRWLVANSSVIRAAALEKAALIADSMVDDEGDGYYGQACVAVAAGIRADALAQSERELAEALEAAWDAGAKHGSSKCLFVEDGDPCPYNPYRNLATGMNATETDWTP